MAAKKDQDGERNEGNGAEQTVEAGRQTVEAGRQGAERMRRGAGEAMESGNRMAERGFAQVADIGRRQADQMRSLMGASARVYGDVGNLSRGDMDALMQTGARLAKGVQDMSWEMMQYTQQSMQASMRAANEMMTCRSVEDMLSVQQNFMRQSVDTFLQESARLLELSNSVASDAVTPLNDRSQRQ